jgi:hypothetical protein
MSMDAGVTDKKRGRGRGEGSKINRRTEDGG